MPTHLLSTDLTSNTQDAYVYLANFDTVVVGPGVLVSSTYVSATPNDGNGVRSNLPDSILINNGNIFASAMAPISSAPIPSFATMPGAPSSA